MAYLHETRYVATANLCLGLDENHRRLAEYIKLMGLTGQLTYAIIGAQRSSRGQSLFNKRFACYNMIEGSVMLGSVCIRDLSTNNTIAPVHA